MRTRARHSRVPPCGLYDHRALHRTRVVGKTVSIKNLVKKKKGDIKNEKQQTSFSWEDDDDNKRLSFREREKK